MEITELINVLVQLFSSDTVSSKFVSALLYIILSSITLSTVADVIIKVFGKGKAHSLVELIKTRLASVESNCSPCSNSNDDIRKRVDMDKVLDHVLEDVVMTTNVDRALLFQFHNGTRAKSGMPFEHIVLTHEADGPGVALSTLINQHNDLRLFSQLSDEMMAGKIIDYKTNYFADPIKSFLKENGDIRMCAKILTSPIDDKIVGALVFTTINDETFDENIESIIERTALVCSGVLTNSWGKCEFCSMRNHVKRKCTCAEVDKKFKNVNNDCSHFSPSAHA